MDKTTVPVIAVCAKSLKDVTSLIGSPPEATRCEPCDKVYRATGRSG
jgi:hypothetical protein